MTVKKALEIVVRYRKHFSELGFPSQKRSHNKRINPHSTEDISASLAHCYSMLNGIEEFVSSDIRNPEKRDRGLVRLGFVQGCLWMAGHYTVEDLKNHSKPDEIQDYSQYPPPLTYDELQDWEY